MQTNELMSDSIEISYHFDELSNVIDSAMHGTSLIHIPVHTDILVQCTPVLVLNCSDVPYCTVYYGRLEPVLFTLIYGTAVQCRILRTVPY